MHFVCIAGIESEAQTLTTERLKSTLILPAQLVKSIPVRVPLEPNYVYFPDKTYGLQFEQELPFNVGIYYYKSPIKDLDCGTIDKKDYSFTNVSITFKAEEFPFTLCSKNMDLSYRISAEVRTDYFKPDGRLTPNIR
ncbi:hypothetical protein CES87_27685 [Pseudomonas sp. ERMR1:02]|nr:hypothetical protein CES87_27685 [Pseudomonas sp. ERMR1:02]